METPPGVRILIVLACLTNVIRSLPKDTNIDCQNGSTEDLGEIDEHYGADIEYGHFSSTQDIELELVPSCSRCDEFLDLIFIPSVTPSVTNVTVRTKKQLDTEALRETNGVLTYNIICANGVQNSRTLTVRDVNDHWPVFDKEEYRANVPETAPVGEVVVQVNAVDEDFSEANRCITYSIQPSSTIFEVNKNGRIFLKQRLNYTVSRQYDFTVKAKDDDDLSNETRVIINIIDDLTPQFESDLYEVSIPENQVGQLDVLTPSIKSNSIGSYTIIPENQVGPLVFPAPIKANTNGNSKIIYGIGEVSPSNYWSNFNVDQSTGNITIITELNFEDIDGPITIHVKASLEIDSTRTSNTTVAVHVEDVNEAPLFPVKLYTAEIFSVAPTQFYVVQVKATDPDEGESERQHYSLMTKSSMFDVEPSSGQVYVAGSVADETGKVTLQVKAEDSHGLYDTTTVEVTIKESASNDVVMISLNQEIGTVQNKYFEMKEALERALGWSVHIISVSSSRGGSTLSRTIEIHPLQENYTPRTYISFLAIETSGTNIIPKETIQKKLLDDEENVLVELRKVFGPDVQFRVEITGSGTNNSIIFGAIIGVALVCIVGGVAAFLGYKRIQSKKITDNNSGEMKPDFALDNNSGERKPNFALDSNSGEMKPDFALDYKSGEMKPDFALDNNSGEMKPDFALDSTPRNGNSRGFSSRPEWGRDGWRQRGTNAGPVGTVPVATNHPTQRFNNPYPHSTQNYNNHYPHSHQNYNNRDQDPHPTQRFNNPYPHPTQRLNYHYHHSRQNYNNRDQDPHSHQRVNNQDPHSNQGYNNHDPHPNHPSVLPPLSRGRAVPQVFSLNRHMDAYRGPMQAGGRRPDY